VLWTQARRAGTSNRLDSAVRAAIIGLTAIMPMEASVFLDRAET
jgi:hypothetical protein